MDLLWGVKMRRKNDAKDSGLNNWKEGVVVHGDGQRGGAADGIRSLVKDLFSLEMVQFESKPEQALVFWGAPFPCPTSLISPGQVIKTSFCSVMKK